MKIIEVILKIVTATFLLYHFVKYIKTNAENKALVDTFEGFKHNFDILDERKQG